MKAKHTDLEKLEQLYKESGNQLVVLYGRRGCQKEKLIVAQVRIEGVSSASATGTK